MRFDRFSPAWRHAAGRLLLACAAAAAWTAPAASAAPDGDDRSLTIGMVNALTGPQARIGRSYRAAAEAVFRDVNAQGGVHGRRLALRSADDAYDPDQTVEQTLEMVDQGEVIALLGFVGTANAVAASPILTHWNVPLVGVYSGGRALQSVDPRVLYQLRASYVDEAQALVDALVARGARRIGVLYQNDGFGHDVRAGAEAALARHRLQVAAAAPYQRGTVAILMAAQLLHDAAPDAVIMAATEETAAAFVKEARALKMTAQWASVSALATHDSALDHFTAPGARMLVSQVVPNPADDRVAAVSECRRLMAAGLGSEGLAHVALEGCLNARTLVRALVDAGPHPTRAAVVASLQAMDSIDLDGLRLPVAARPQAGRAVYLTELVDGRLMSTP